MRRLRTVVFIHGCFWHQHPGVHLAKLFRRHGAPLFLKRDNGSPLNHAAVNAVLAEFGVIPLNSPAHSISRQRSCSALPI